MLAKNNDIATDLKQLKVTIPIEEKSLHNSISDATELKSPHQTFNNFFNQYS
jgi:hypothetical protein